MSSKILTLADLAESARLEGSARGIVVKLEAPAQLIISGDAELLGGALENVLRNALRHSLEGGEVELLAEVTDTRVNIQVLDLGPGVPPERLDDIFEPFMRVNEARDAGGSGLAIARAAMREQMQAWRADCERPDRAAWRQAMSDILTPEQQALLAERRQDKRGKRSCNR